MARLRSDLEMAHAEVTTFLYRTVRFCAENVHNGTASSESTNSMGLAMAHT